MKSDFTTWLSTFRENIATYGYYIGFEITRSLCYE